MEYLQDIYIVGQACQTQNLSSQHSRIWVVRMAAFASIMNKVI